MKILKEENNITKMINREIFSMNEDVTTTFNIKDFDNLRSFSARKRYADQNLNKIAAGSGRIVYKTPDGKALKLAKNSKGIAQNELECQLGNDYYAKSNLTKVFDCDPSNLWVLAEEAKKLNPNRFYQLTGVKIEDLKDFLEYNINKNKPKGYSFKEPSNSEELWENEFVYSINDLMINYDIPSGDLGRLSSYGEVIRDGQPTVVLTDYGLNDEIYNTHYNKIRESIGSYFDEEDSTLLDLYEQKTVEQIKLDEYIEDIHDVLQKSNITPNLFANKLANKFGYNKVEYYGSGTQGMAFRLDNGNTIMKITSDFTEANEANKLKGKKFKHLGEFYRVIRINEPYNKLFIILREYLDVDVNRYNELTIKSEDEIKKFVDYEDGDINNYFTSDKINNIQDSDINKLVDNTKLLIKKYGVDEFSATSQFIGLVDDLKKNNIISSDIGGNNVGFRPNGDMAFYDIGYTNNREYGNFETIQYESINLDEMIIESMGDIITERILSWMPKSKSVEVKQKCRLGDNKSLSTQQTHIKYPVTNKPNMIKEAEITDINKLPFKQEIEEMGGKIFSVGGAVRDKFLGKDSKDLDILITGIEFDKLGELLQKYGKVDAVGKSFGIIKFQPKGSTEDIDIAIPRTEKKVGDGHKGFEVTSDHNLPIEDDLRRRDFTINAIAKDSSGNLIDPYGGQDDLKNKLIRVVNPDAFSEDSLRMLRAVQFSSRFNFTIEPETMKLIKLNAPKIKEIAGERILIELEKIVTKGDKRIGAQLLKDTGLFKNIFDFELNQSTIDRSPFEDVKSTGEFIYLLIRLSENPANLFRNKLKGDINTFKEIEALTMGFKDVSNSIVKNRVVVHNMFIKSPNSINSMILPNELKVASEGLKSGQYPKSIKELDIDGNDVMNLGFKGKEIGDILKRVLLNIYSDKISNNKNEIIAFIKN